MDAAIAFTELTGAVSTFLDFKFDLRAAIAFLYLWLVLLSTFFGTHIFAWSLTMFCYGAFNKSARCCSTSLERVFKPCKGSQPLYLSTWIVMWTCRKSHGWYPIIAFQLRHCWYQITPITRYHIRSPLLTPLSGPTIPYHPLIPLPLFINCHTSISTFPGRLHFLPP